MKIGRLEFYTHTDSKKGHKPHKKIGWDIDTCSSCPMYFCEQQYSGDYWEECDIPGKEPFYDISFVCYLPNFVKKLLHKHYEKKSQKISQAEWEYFQRLWESEENDG